eukprot:10726028-Heterocapsa_arctica.AAC.1
MLQGDIANLTEIQRQTTVTAEAAAAAAANAATVALQASAAAPPWSHWKAAQIQGRGWLDKKARRAELHSHGIL